MNASHHLTNPILTAYAAGTLDEAYALVVACHLSLCDQCRIAVETFDTLGGAVIDDMPEVSMSDNALAATFERIKAGNDLPPAPPAPKAASVFPAPLQAYAGADSGDVAWRKVGGGIKQKLLACGGEATARLLYIPAGKAVPDHGHRGLELTLVLQGSFSDKIAQFTRGDVEIGDSTLEHKPVADPGEACICLAATDAPLRFNALIPRIFQPFVKI